ncbi:MAG TPA: response regulator transcription factor [Bryobacteraceae bacterium]|nr:response regulator transcription factor [Bryobacteraceae bacterium]
MNSETPVSIVIADDHTIVREGIAALCAATPELAVIGQCADGEAAIELIYSLKPDFAILDLHMPKLTGLDVVRRLRDSGCPTRLMILSICRDEATVAEILRAGADAYLLKDGPSRHILDAVRYIQDGGVYLSPLLRGPALFTGPAKTPPPDPLAGLSQREYEVFTHLVKGVRPKDIASKLSISPKTVDTYRASLMRKLNVRDLVELVKFAIERKLTSTSST